MVMSVASLGFAVSDYDKPKVLSVGFDGVYTLFYCFFLYLYSQMPRRPSATYISCTAMVSANAN